jgi:hypothetical protein
VFSVLTRLLSCSLRQPLRRPSGHPGHRIRPRLEALECRTTPTISVAFTGTSLTITGDNAANTLTITQGADHRLTITAPTEQIRLNRLPPGAVGVPLTLAQPVTGPVTINLNRGNDVLTIGSATTQEVQLPSSLTINNGVGNNTVNFADSVAVGGNVTVINSTGNDTTNLNDLITVSGRFTILNGDGDNLVAGTDTDMQVDGAFTVTGGTGFDEIDLSNTVAITVGGLTVNNGADRQGSATTLLPAEGLTVYGGVRIVNGNGDDTVDLGFAYALVSGNVVISNGSGGNATTLVTEDNALFIFGTTSITGTGGADDVSIGSNLADVTIGALTVSSGDGVNTLALAGNQLSVNGRLTVSGGRGRDEVAVSTQFDGTVRGRALLSLGAGGSITSLAAATDSILTFDQDLRFTAASSGDVTADQLTLTGVVVRLNTLITTGNGSDVVTINDSVFLALFTLTTAAGHDAVNIEQGAGTPTTEFVGAVVVSTGVGDDAVRVGVATGGPAARVVNFYSTSRFDGGAGVVDGLLLEEDDTENVFFGPDPVVVNFEINPAP